MENTIAFFWPYGVLATSLRQILWETIPAHLEQRASDCGTGAKLFRSRSCFSNGGPVYCII
jgi:hypothetical protein